MANEYTEIKVTCELDGAPSDVLTVFSGFVDRNSIEFDERTDGINLNVFTADDLATRLAAENITTQYINPDIDGAGTDGLIFRKLPDMFLKSANVTSYVLKTGQHSITYEYNGGTRRAKLDSGLWVTIGTDNTTYTLGNGASTSVDTERVQIYVKDRTLLPSGSTAVVEYIIVTAEGQTLCKQWYQNIGCRQLLKKIYEKMGITSVNFDTLSISSYDGRKEVSWLDTQIDDSILSSTRAVVGDGTDLWLGIGNKLYKRTASTSTYTLMATLTSTLTIVRLWYNARNNHIWIHCRQGTNFAAATIVHYNVGTATLSNELSISAYTTKPSSFDLVDYNYTGSSYKYSLVFINNLTDAREVTLSGSTLSQNQIVADATLKTHFIYQRAGGEVYFSMTTNYKKMTINSSGLWGAAGTVLAPTIEYYTAAFHTSEDYVYFHVGGETARHAHNSSSYSLITNTPPSNVHTMLYSSNDAKVLCTGVNTSTGVNCIGTLESGSYTNVDDDASYRTDKGADNDYQGLALPLFTLGLSGTTVFGVDRMGNLFQWSSTLVLFAPQAVFSGKTVRDALNQTLNGFLLVSIISGMKQAFVYRRGDSSGTPQTTGNTISITVSEASDLVEVVRHYTKAEFIKVTNANQSVNFNGTVFDTNVLSDVRTIDINNDLIPDQIIRDIAYYAYQFFKTDRNLYRIELGKVPLFQYEPFDNCSITFNGNIVRTASGPIYSTEKMKDGTMMLEVLI
jgi:hypothetical protein